MKTQARILRLFSGLCAAALLAGCGQAYVRGGKVNPAEVVASAKSQLGRSYHYHGDSPQTGFDCSGFVCWAFGQNGLLLPHQVSRQVAYGRAVSLDHLKPGDLVFFDTSGHGRATHVGIYEGEDVFIHAPSTGGFVREDKLWNRYWKRHFLTARRISS